MKREAVLDLTRLFNIDSLPDDWLDKPLDWNGENDTTRLATRCKQKLEKCYLRQYPELFTRSLSDAANQTVDAHAANFTVLIITTLSVSAEDFKNAISSLRKSKRFKQLVRLGKPRKNARSKATIKTGTDSALCVKSCEQ